MDISKMTLAGTLATGTKPTKMPEVEGATNFFGGPVRPSGILLPLGAVRPRLDTVREPVSVCAK